MLALLLALLASPPSSVPCPPGTEPETREGHAGRPPACHGPEAPDRRRSPPAGPREADRGHPGLGARGTGRGGGGTGTGPLGVGSTSNIGIGYGGGFGSGRALGPRRAAGGAVTFCGRRLARDTTRVRCADPELDDLRPLAGLPGLKRLEVPGTRVTDLGPLAGLKALEHLDLSRTPVADLAPLAGLPIRTLLLRDAAVRDLGPLAKCRALKKLDATSTRVTSLDPLLDLPALRSVRVGKAHVPPPALRAFTARRPEVEVRDR